MTIYEALKNDHETLKTLINRLIHLNPEDEDERAQILAQLQTELITHTHAEESIFYNSLRSIETVRDLILPSYEEHIEAESTLHKLAANSKIDNGWEQEAIAFKRQLDQHIRDEETRIFTAAQQIFTDQEAEMMATAYNELKPEVAEGSFVQNTLDAIASLMPPRFAGPVRTLGTSFLRHH